MRKNIILVAALLSIGTAQAAVCQLMDVQINSISRYSSTSSTATLNNVVSGIAAGADACAGAYAGNDGFYPTTNLGYAGDGLLNGGTQVATGSTIFPGGAFITPQYPLQDLNKNDGAGVAKDPGWIMLGKFEQNATTNVWGFTPNAIGGNSTLVLSSFFTATVDAAGKGTWSFTPDAQAGTRASQAGVLGKNWFDQFALVFKAGDDFAAYDFTYDRFIATGLISGIPLATDPMLNWSGTYDVSNTIRTGGQDGTKNPAGLSHISLWVRDPAAVNDIPEPTTIALLGLGLLGICVAGRRKA